MQTRHFTELPPLSLYIHIPWCIRKCPYCDFNSHKAPEHIPEQAYVDALLDDLAYEMPGVWGRQIHSVFIGGGTPSLFSAQALDRLMSGVRALTALPPSAEVTLEANPGSFEQQRFKDYRDLGINRLSVGIQSFNDTHLKALGRVHGAMDAHKACEIAHSAGFEQINLDLMFALPNQTPEELQQDIEQALGQQSSHLSFYELTLEPNTYFAKFPPPLPSDDRRADMQSQVVQILGSAGFDRYEVSAYARADATLHRSVSNRCQHNMNYWQFGDYIGIGCGAHGKISAADSQQIVRRCRQKHPTQYLADSVETRVITEEIIPIEDTAFEFMMNALRLREGFAVPVFEKHTGVSLHQWQHTIEQAVDRGLLEQAGLELRTTPTGYNWLNTVLELFMPENVTNNTKRYNVINIQAINKDSQR